MFDDIFQDLKKLQSDMNGLLDSAWKRHIDKKFKSDSCFPLIDIRENPKDIIVSVELPGINESEIKINIKENRLEIRAERRIERKIKAEKYIANERRYKSFYRALVLPKKVIPEKSTRTYMNGVLKIVMPKAKEH